MPHAHGPGKLPPCPEETLFVDMVRTTDLLSRGLTQLLKAEGLSPAQYNVLRILRGAPEGLLCGEIGDRMISRDPDITRVLDRMEKRGLVSRCRQHSDRRRIQVRISDAGMELLARLDEPIRKVHRRQLGHLAPRQRQNLAELLEACRFAPIEIPEYLLQQL